MQNRHWQRHHLSQVNITNPIMQASSSNFKSFHGVHGVDFLEEREIRWEVLMAETNTCQCLHHLVKHNFVSSWGEVKSITAWYKNVNPCLHLEKYAHNTVISQEVHWKTPRPEDWRQKNQRILAHWLLLTYWIQNITLEEIEGLFVISGSSVKR